MKILLIIIALATGATFFLPKRQDISGTWVMENKGQNFEAAIIRIQFGEGYYAAKLDMPGQLIYDKSVILDMKNDSIRFLLDEKENCFIQAVIKDSLMTGRSVVEGKVEEVSFRRLKN